MIHRPIRRAGRLLAAAILPVGVVAAAAAPADAHSVRHGTLYTLSNDAAGNRVLAFARASDGSLSPAGSFATGGNGAGAGLGSQGAVVVTDNGRRLIAVNAGSDSISLFAVDTNGGLDLLDTVASGGHHPISVTVHDEVVYALNGADNTISGFSFDDRDLEPLAGTTRTLTGTGAAEIAFTPNGHQLVVTEKASNLIDVFAVDDGIAGSALPTASTGMTPFGFAFDRHGHLLVSNAAGGAPAASSLTSYAVDRSGALDLLDGPAPTHQTAACWVVVSRDSRFAYATNTGSGTISGYHVAPDGSLSLLNADGVTATTGAGPTDATITRGDLYSVGSGSHTITVDHIEHDGSLTPVATLTGLPANAAGLAAS